MTDEQKKVIDRYMAKRTSVLYSLRPNDTTTVRSAEVKTKHIALTVDCCYEAERWMFLKKLFCYMVKGLHPTFFMTGIFLSRSPSAVRIIKLLGFDIMNHSVSHKSFLNMSCEEQYAEIADNAKEIERITGKRPNLFRFPYGEFGANSVRVLKSLDMLQIQWSVDTADWLESATDESVYRSIMDHAESGSIILTHLLGGGFRGAMKAVSELKKQGYKFVSVNRLLQLEKEQK